MTKRTTWRPPLILIGGMCLVVLFGAGQPLYGQDTDEAAAADTGRTARPLPAAPPDSVTADDVGPGADERAIVEADSLSAFVRNGQRLQELFNDVTVRQDSTRLRSAFALRYLDRNELLFTGDVVIYERGDTLRADTVRYNKRTKVGRARSNVRLTDGEVTVRAPRATYYTEEKRSVFSDSVTLVDSTRVLRAQSGTYWSDARRAEFQGHVRLTDPETRLTADSLTYYRDRERSIARGRVAIRRMEQEEDGSADTATRTYLFGRWVDNQEQSRFSRVEGQALLVRVRMDSTGAPDDTLIVRGRRLDAYRSDARRRLVAVDSVRIWENDLAAVADSTVYDRIVAADTTDTLGTPRPIPEDTAPQSLQGTYDGASADAALSADAAPTADSVQGPPSGAPADSTAPDSVQRKTGSPKSPSSRWAGPSVETEADVPMEETRLFGAPVTWFEQSQVWGDSIRVRARRRTIDTVFVRGSAFAAQRDSTLDRIQQLTGQNLTAIFRADSLRRITAGPTARAIRFLKTDTGTLKGAAQTSGDRIVLRFRGGSVRRTSILGGVESTYYRTPESVPSPFHLDGFQWTPERRPAKAGLLRGRWEEARLDGHSAPARPDSVAVPPDAEQVPPSRPDSSSSALSQSPSTSP